MPRLARPNWLPWIRSVAVHFPRYPRRRHILRVSLLGRIRADGQRIKHAISLAAALTFGNEPLLTETPEAASPANVVPTAARVFISNWRLGPRQPDIHRRVLFGDSGVVGCYLCLIGGIGRLSLCGAIRARRADTSTGKPGNQPIGARAAPIQFPPELKNADIDF